MSEITVTDYETVEVEKELYECDHCHSRVEEEQINTIGYVEGNPRSTARFSDRSVNQKHLCEGCIGLREALEVQTEQKNKMEYYREWWSNTRKKIVWLAFMLPTFIFGFGSAWLAIELHEIPEQPSWPIDILSGITFAIIIAVISGAVTMMIYLAFIED